jgi:hypothetical protein
MMKKVKMLWMPLLLGTLLMATLVGVAGARPNARPEASPQLLNYMFSGHHCIPRNNSQDWDFMAEYLECDTPTCHVICPTKPPHEGLIRLQRLAMYVYDNAAGDVCIWLRHVYPKTGTRVDRLSLQCTTDNAADPQVYTYNPANFKVSVLQDLYVWVTISGTAQELYGFKLKYEPL